jgi:hypothetical protein
VLSTWSSIRGSIEKKEHMSRHISLKQRREVGVRKAESANPDSAALNSALGTELFVLQAVASSTISESGTRATIYLSALASSLVALGFAGDSPRLLSVLTFTLLPTAFALGWFTVVRLVDTSVENIVVRRRMARIRQHFAGLHPDGPHLIAVDSPRSGELGVRYARSSFLFTTASIVGLVNAVVGGASVTLGLSTALSAPTSVSAPVGVSLGSVLLIATWRYERRRIRAAAAT